MAQFDVYAPRIGTNARTPYVIALQSNLLEGVTSVVVAALKRAEGTPKLTRLMPLLIVNGEKLIFVPTEIVSLPKGALGHPIANLSSEREKIIAALDVLFTGI